MSVNYADGLSDYDHKGKCGMPEVHDSPETVEEKVNTFVELISSCQHMVVITGAGISTSAGIPDFRGPNGVWTLEKKGIKPQVNITFENAAPTPTHMALVALEKAGYLKYVISQNVDGLHIRSGLPRNRLSELHGDMFVEDCEKCYASYIRANTLPTMALNYTGNSCTQMKKRGKCRGKLRDTILDWEDNLPEKDTDLALHHCKTADLCLCLGTSLQIVPCGNMPLATKRNGGKIVIINLQSTKQDKKCDLKIHAYVDDIMTQVCTKLGVDIPQWTKPHVVLKSIHTDKSEDLSCVIVDECLLLPEQHIEEKIATKKEGKDIKKTVPKLQTIKDENCTNQNIHINLDSKIEVSTCESKVNTDEKVKESCLQKNGNSQDLPHLKAETVTKCANSEDKSLLLDLKTEHCDKSSCLGSRNGAVKSEPIPIEENEAKESEDDSGIAAKKVKLNENC